jgi:hypothetical protein
MRFWMRCASGVELPKAGRDALTGRLTPGFAISTDLFAPIECDDPLDQLGRGSKV